MPFDLMFFRHGRTPPHRKSHFKTYFIFSISLPLSIQNHTISLSLTKESSSSLTTLNHQRFQGGRVVSCVPFPTLGPAISGAIARGLEAYFLVNPGHAEQLEETVPTIDPLYKAVPVAAQKGNAQKRQRSSAPVYVDSVHVCVCV